jgi:hypothetical protein
MSFWEHITAGVLAGIILRSILAAGTLIGLLIKHERHVLVHERVRSGMHPSEAVALTVGQS